MKIRRIGLVYFFSIFSCGIYFIYWLVSLVYEINKYFNEKKIKHTLVILLIIVFIIFMLSVQILNIIKNEILLYFLCYPLGICYLLLITSILFKIIKYVYIIQEIECIKQKINREICLMMFLVFFSGIIILQGNINEIANKLLKQTGKKMMCQEINKRG